MDSSGLVDSSWTSVAREQLLEDLALPGEDGGAVAGYGSGGVVPEHWQWQRGIGESENNNGK